MSGLPSSELQPDAGSLLVSRPWKVLESRSFSLRCGYDASVRCGVVLSDVCVCVCVCVCIQLLVQKSASPRLVYSACALNADGHK